jgi:adenylate cyclase
VVGQVIFELAKEPSPQMADARRRVVGWALGVFCLTAFFGHALLARRKENQWPVLMDTLKQVAAGRLDVKIPLAPDQKDLSDALNNMIEALQERDRMRNSLGRIMDPRLAEALIKEDPKLGARRRQATILFCDIRNYTSLCEGMDPESLQEFLNEYWKGTVEIIMEQEGTIDKFHGDGVCVVFGAPMLHEDDPMRAVRTAWRLVGNVASINERRTAQRKIPIQIGVGIHNGEVLAGHIGSERRMDYTVVGDAVNVAARIEELNKKFGTQILISDSVYEKVEAAVRVRTLTLAHLRGHKRPILIHALKEFHDPAVARKSEAA